MFAYFTKMNGTNIITYTHDMARLYFDEDDCDSGSGDSSCSGDNEYLFNNQTISSDIASGTSGYEEMPPPFATQPPLLFSYC